MIIYKSIVHEPWAAMMAAFHFSGKKTRNKSAAGAYPSSPVMIWKQEMVSMNIKLHEVNWPQMTIK